MIGSSALSACIYETHETIQRANNPRATICIMNRRARARVELRPREKAFSVRVYSYIASANERADEKYMMMCARVLLLALL